MKTPKAIILGLVLCLIAVSAYGEVNRPSNWARRGLRGGGLALDGIAGVSIHQNDTAYVVDISGATAYSYVPIDTGSTTESTAPSILIITPDSLQAGGDDSSGGTTTWRLTGISGDTLYARTLVIDTTTITDIFDDDTLGSDSDTALATQQSIKAYVDSQSHGGGGGGSGLTTMSTSDSSGARTEAEADTIGDAPGGMFLEFDPVSGGSGYGTGNTIYTSNDFLNQDVKTTATPSFSSVTPQAVYLDPIGEQTITAAAQAIGVTDYSTMHISSDASYTITSTPSFVGGRAGQILYVHNHGSFDMTFQDNSVLTGSSVFIGRSPGTLHSDSTMTLVYSSKVSGFRIYSNPNTAIAGANATITNVRNETGGALNSGKYVHATGWSNGHARVTVELADADDPAKYPALGVLTSTLANNQNGEAIVFGEIINLIDTSGRAVEDGVWLSTTAGEVVFDKPSTDCVQKLGEITRVGNANASAIFAFGAGRCNDTPWEIEATGASIYAKPDGASGLSVFGLSDVTKFQVDSRGVFVETPTLPKHAVDKAYSDLKATKVELDAAGAAGAFTGATKFALANQLDAATDFTGVSKFNTPSQLVAGAFTGATKFALANQLAAAGDFTGASKFATPNQLVVGSFTGATKFALDTYLGANAVSLSGATITGTLPVSKGGTGQVASGTSNDPVVSDGANFIPVNPGSARKALGFTDNFLMASAGVIFAPAFTGDVLTIALPFSGTLRELQLVLDPSGTAGVSIYRAPKRLGDLGGEDSIAGVSVVSGSTTFDTGLEGGTTTFASGDVIMYHIFDVTGGSTIFVTMKIEKDL